MIPIQNKPQQPIKQSPLPQAPVASTPVSGYSYMPALPLDQTPPVISEAEKKKPISYLVRENVFQSAASTVKSYGKYAKAFYNAGVKGEGTDYSVGKVNDLAIRAGSLGIAGVLATSKLFPFAKGMEFVGLATWFASMAVWPKIMGAPIKAKTGVDINQRYVDSYDRRKSFFEDPQYLPFDLYRYVGMDGKPMSKEDYNKKYKEEYVYLNHIGDKLGIPRDIKNRNEAIQDKMRQVATQGNSLWMLTAGVMTPVLSSLAADALQQPLKDTMEKVKYSKQEKSLNQLNTKLDSLLSKHTTNLSEVMQELDIKIAPEVKAELDSLNKSRLSKPEFAKLKDFMHNRFFGTGFYDAFQDEMKTFVQETDPIVSISPEFKERLKKISSDSIKEIVESATKGKTGKALEDAIKEIPKELLDFKGLDDGSINNIIKATFKHETGDLNVLASNSLKNLFPREMAMVLNKNNSLNTKWVQKINAAVNSKTEAYFNECRHYDLDTAKVTRLFDFIETNVRLKDKVSKFEEVTIKNISESMTANNWGKLPKKYFKVLGFSQAEMAEIATTSSVKSVKIISRKFEEIATDPVQFEQVIKTMSKFASEAVTKEEKAVIALVGTKNAPGVLTKIKKVMESVAWNNFSKDINQPLSIYYQNKIKSVKYKLRNTTDSFVKPIKALDIYRVIPKKVMDLFGHTEAEYKAKILADQAKWDYYPFHHKSYEDAKRIFTKYLKEITLEKNDINNWSTKFEAAMPGAKTGINHSKALVSFVSNTMFDELSPMTTRHIDPNFVKKIDQNNTVMRGRFAGLANRLWTEMTESRPLWSVVEDLFVHRKVENYDTLMAVVEELKGEGDGGRLHDCKLKLEAIKDAIKNGIHYPKAALDADIAAVADTLNFKVKNTFFDQYNLPTKNNAKLSGKNIVEFLRGAAEDTRSRNKWSKLVYGLLIGTTALSAIVISQIGKKNYFNKDIYEKKTAQGVNSDNK